jgi:hypothetical protein
LLRKNGLRGILGLAGTESEEVRYLQEGSILTLECMVAVIRVCRFEIWVHQSSVDLRQIPKQLFKSSELLIGC